LSDLFQTYRNPFPEMDATIVLIRPPIAFSAKAYSTPLTMPIGVAYLAAALEKARYQVQLIDCVGEAIDRIVRLPGSRYKIQGLDVEGAIKRISPSASIIGISVMFSQEWPLIRRFVTRLHEAFPSARLVLGGEAVTALPEYTLKDCPVVDCLVLGEGEIAFLQLCHAILSGRPYDDIAGLAFKRKGEFVSNGLAPRWGQLKEIPWPAWHLLPIQSYFMPNFTMGISKGKNIGILATRGCPYTCTFCSNPSMWTTRYVMREPDDVLDEIEYYVRSYGANSIDFYDLTAIVKKEWILEFCRKMLSRGIRVAWQLPSGTRSEALDEEVLELLHRAGCAFLVYAPESGSSATLHAVKKRLQLEKITRSILTAKRYQMVVKINLIIGFPFERRREMLKTVLFALKMAWRGVDDCNITTFTPYPGSELFREMVATGQIPVINDAYFESLMTQFDLTLPKAYCRHVGGLEILGYRILGLMGFYLLTYLRRPRKLWLLIKSVPFKKLEPHSLFEQRISDLLRRASFIKLPSQST